MAGLVNESPCFSSLHQWELLTYVVADMHSDKSSVRTQGLTRKGIVTRDYFCNRASGLSAPLQDQQSMRSETDTETVSFINSISTVQLIPNAPDADNII